MRTIDDLVTAVIAADACSGCGACTQLDDGLRMELDTSGYLRPVRRGPSSAAADAAAAFDRSCPGRTVRAARPAGSTRHATMGPSIAAWRAWAVDPEIRFAGSSGGTLTAISAWLVQSGEAARSVGAIEEPSNPRRTVSLTLTSREQALASSGSRYAPTASAGAQHAAAPDTAMVGKPCEASAIRMLTEGGEAPLILGFFCAGTPSQSATDALVAELGIPADEPLRALRYRGAGWPGRFTATARSGRSVSTDYASSWGNALGPTVQWRCKICPDGVAEHADIVAADLWQHDERGYPTFEDSEGVSALIARTRRGADVVRRAVEAGIIQVEPLDLDELAGVQPLQRTRRFTLAGRLLGTVLAGRRVPTYRGFGLLALGLRAPRRSLRYARGSFRRRRAAG